MVTVDYAIAGRQNIPSNCSDIVSGLDYHLKDIKNALIGLKENRGKEKIEKIIELWSTLKNDMKLKFDEFHINSESASGLS